MEFLLRRYNTDGSVDTSFGANGRVVTNFLAGFSEAAAVAIQSDGRILAAGSAGNDFALARFNEDGTPDNTFGADGRVITNLSIDSFDEAFGIAIQPNGQIVVVGRSDGDFAVVRYEANGNRDLGFGVGGIVITDVGIGSADVARDVVIQPNGRIVVAGQAGMDFAIARYESDGDLDITFASAGRVVTDFPGATNDIAYRVALQSNGRIVAVGQAGTDVAVARYQTNGTLDGTFDGDGRVATNVHVDDAGRDVSIEPDGQIVVAGRTGVDLHTDFAVLRYNSNGTLDSTFVMDFGPWGMVRTDFPIDRQDEALAVALQPDGRILAVGRSNEQIALARYLGTDEAPRASDTLGLYSPANGAFHLRTVNAAGPADVSFLYGSPGLVPLSGDWNGDNVDTVGVYDPATGVFFLRNSNAAGTGDVSYQFGPGGAALIPLVGDWNGDGIDTAGLYNPATGNFFLRNSHAAGAADIAYRFGAGGQGYRPLKGNWDGVGGDTVGLYQPNSSVFFLRNAHAGGPADVTFQFGAAAPNTLPVSGNWDGIGGDSVGVYRQTDGAVFLRNTNNAGVADVAYLYGPPGNNWTPVTGDWNGPSLSAIAAPGDHRRPPNAAVLETLFAQGEDWLA
jgi:uncharacterized delta-60 repeat protein